MNKKNYILLLFVFLLQQCSNQGFDGVSKNIEQSKERGVYKFEYYPNANPIRINDSINLIINEVWVEQTWKYGNQDNKIFPQEQLQICINSTEGCLKYYDEAWTIENSFVESFNYSSRNSLVVMIEKLNMKDTFAFNIVKGSPSLNDSVEIINHLFLIKKKKLINR